MAKNAKGRRRRKNSKHYEDDSEDESLDPDGNNNNNTNTNNYNHCKTVDSKAASGNNNNNNNNNNSSKNHKNKHKHKSDLSFAERREVQRKAAAEKRRQKMKCYLCGKTGHVRRECPGIADDGRGESKYTKSNGDAGATHLKHRGRNNNTTKKHHHHGNSSISLPPGFDKAPTPPAGPESESQSQPPPFVYYDAGFGEGRAVLEYLRFGRHGHGGGNHKSHSGHSSNNINSNSNNSNNHTQVSKQDAISEYDASMKGVCETTNFGGCIVRSYLPTPPSKPSTAPAATTMSKEPWCWRPHDSFPFSWFEETPSLLKFVIGYPLEYHCCNDDDAAMNHGGAGDENIANRGGISQEMVNRLVEAANHHKSDIVGFFADLEYNHNTTLTQNNNNNNGSRAFQLQRLRSTLKAASMVDCPVQIRIAPGYKPALSSLHGEANNGNDNNNGNGNNNSNASPIDGYSLAIRDLGEILLEASVYPWKVHLSSWNGKAEHLVALSGAFSSASHQERKHDLQQQQPPPTRKHQLVFGFDGSLGFSKAVHLHESAFEVDPWRVVLETGGPGILPPVVAKHGGRNAFCHSGQIPFVAEELAKHLSKNPRHWSFCRTALGNQETPMITAEIVARWASATTMALYGLQ